MRKLLEFEAGHKVAGAKYIQRIGSPGNYTYIYPSKAQDRSTRHDVKAYNRLMIKSKHFFKRITTRFGATNSSYTPVTNKVGILTLKNRKGVVKFKLNLYTQKIQGYSLTQKGVLGVTPVKKKAKRNGILRYR